MSKFTESQAGPGKRVEVLATKIDKLSLILRAHIVEGGSQPPPVVL